MKKAEVLETLRKAFNGQGRIHVSDVMEWMGADWFKKAKKYADAEGFIKL